MKASLGLIRELIFLDYFHGVSPLRVENCRICLNDGSYISPFSTDLYLDILLSHGWESSLEYVEKDGYTLC